MSEVFGEDRLTGGRGNEHFAGHGCQRDIGKHSSDVEPGRDAHPLERLELPGVRASTVSAGALRRPKRIVYSCGWQPVVICRANGLTSALVAHRRWSR